LDDKLAMSAAAVTVEECAKALKVTTSTVRGWIRDGAPVVSPGQCGRGNGARIDLARLSGWRAQRLGLTVDDDSRMLRLIAVALLEVFERDGGDGAPLHRSIGIPNAKAAALLVESYTRIHQRITGTDPEKLPPEIERILTVCVSSARRSHLGAST
jgi:hypothetical protein